MMKFVALLNQEILPSLQEVEVYSTFQIPSFHIVGLPAPEVSEARERIRAALENSGFEFPRRRLVINLSPASIRKQGTGCDLAMALAILIHSSAFKKIKLHSKIVLATGELGLNGSVKSAGQLTRVLYAGWMNQVSGVLIPSADRERAFRILRLFEESKSFAYPLPQVIPVSDLKQACESIFNPTSVHLNRRSDDYPEALSERDVPYSTHSLLPLSPFLERVIGVATAGNHHLLILGSRGTGKTYSLDWRIGLQPPPCASIQIQQHLIEELSGNDPGSHLHSHDSARMVRRVSPQARVASLLGTIGPHGVYPGEFSKAHGGLLIADELPEWSRDAREALREPLEQKHILLTRFRKTVELPANFTLIATGNFCPCGGWPPHLSLPSPTPKRLPRCRCTERVRELYLNRLSGPLLDRMDLVVSVGHSSEARPAPGQNTIQKLKDHISTTQSLCLKKWGNLPGNLNGEELETLIQSHLHWDSRKVLNQLMSLRSKHKVLRVALSLAAWDGLSEPQSGHFLEAQTLRGDFLVQDLRSF